MKRSNPSLSGINEQVRAQERAAANFDRSERLSLRIAQLPSDQRELVLRRLKTLGNARPVDVRNHTEPTAAPLSLLQHQLWLAQVLTPSSIAYNVPMAIRVNGHLHEQAMRLALFQIVERHAVLRSVFTDDTGEVRQRITAGQQPVMTVADLQSIEEDRREKIGRKCLEIALRTPFDLRSGPVMRCLLIRLTNQDRMFSVIVHHLIFDGWSKNILLRELNELYNSFIEGRPALLPALRQDYLDYARWQREPSWIEAYQAQLEYWMRKLTPLPKPLTIRTDWSEEIGSLGLRTDFVIDREVTGNLKRLSANHRVTLFTTVLTALAVVVRHLTGDPEVVIGTDVVNRKPLWTEELIGFFVNQIVIRLQLAEYMTVKEMLAQARETVYEGLANADVPFETIVSKLRPQRHSQAIPIFQIKLSLENTPATAINLHGLQISAIPIHSGASRLPLELVICEDSSRLIAIMTHNPKVFGIRFSSRIPILLEEVMRSFDYDGMTRLADLDDRLKRAEAESAIHEGELLCSKHLNKAHGSRRKPVWIEENG